MTNLRTTLINKHNIPIKKDNIEIFDIYSQFVNDEDYLITALVQNPFYKNTNLENIKIKYGKKVFDNLQILNLLTNHDSSIIADHQSHKNIFTLFLVNHCFLLKNKQNLNNAKQIFSKKDYIYALKVLETCDFSKLRDDLEDRLFSITNSNTFNKYKSQLQLNLKSYKTIEQKVKEKITKLIKKKNINGEIQSRIKTIFSIHEKITNKNILLSQVLDVVGLRLIAEKESDCYTIMEEILLNWPVIKTKIKDYIAVPKENGYKSIHLTILADNYPIEIQIRTYKMHHIAEYGKSAHKTYKKPAII